MNLAQRLDLPNIGSSDSVITGPLGEQEWTASIGSVITRLLPYIFSFAGMIFLLMILFGGFGLLTSTGDPKKLQASQQRITMAVVGFIIIFIAYWVVQILGTMLGFTEVTDVFTN